MGVLFTPPMMTVPRSSSSCPSTQEMWRGKKKGIAVPQALRDEWTSCVSLEGGTLEVSGGAISNL